MHINCLELLAECVPPDTSASMLFQLEAGFINRNNRHLHSGLESVSRVCEPPMMSLIAYSGEDSAGEGQSGLGGTTVEDTAMVPPLLLQLLVGIPLLIPVQDVVISPTQEEFIMPAGVPQLVVWPLSSQHQSRLEGFSEGASRLLESSWREIRPNQHMSHSSNIGLVGVRSGLEIPLEVL